MRQKYSVIAAFALAMTLLASCGKNEAEPRGIVPRPVQMEAGKGSFEFDASTRISADSEEGLKEAERFAELFTVPAGFTPAVVSEGDAEVRLVTDSSLSPEAYSLKVTKRGIDISASGSEGFFYAFQSLRQLLPPQLERNTAVPEMEWKAGTVTVSDEPRFEYRSLMLDAARHFIPKDEVIKLIDCAAMLKINTLHLHLTDDNGWRIEIKEYPSLTAVGASRVDRGEEHFAGRRNPRPGEPVVPGGFYTQDDIREIVAYAADRHIEVIPEIDMPAHSNAAIASYPDLCCPVVHEHLGVLPGLGGRKAEIILCAGKESVFDFMENVLDEIMELFPSRFIHIGGDEAVKTYWRKCPLCQSRIRSEGLANEEDLQGYFMDRISKYVRSKGREVIGWDELTNSSFLPENSIIMGWQGEGTAAFKAADMGHRFILTPAKKLYLIRYQGPQWFEPITYFGNNTLKDVYEYEPTASSGWKDSYGDLLMGVQASLWTEFSFTPEMAEYMIFPRLAALAEVAWSPLEARDWTAFLQALDNYDERLDAKGVTWAKSMYNVQHKSVPEDGVLKVTLECIRPDAEIRCTADGRDPDLESSLYDRALTVKEPVRIKARTFTGGKSLGKMLDLSISWNAATAKDIIDSNADLAYVLTNGVRGSLKNTDGEWATSRGKEPLRFTVDMGESEKLGSLSLGCLTFYSQGIHKPSSVQIEVSDDNVNFKTVASRKWSDDEIFVENHAVADILSGEELLVKNHAVEDLSFDLGGALGRYVRITAASPGPCPESHVHPGFWSKVCFDEVVVETVD